MPRGGTPVAALMQVVTLGTSLGMADVFAAIDQRFPHAVFLDSAGGPTALTRYSYICADPFLLLRSKDRCVEIAHGLKTEQMDADPLDVLGGLLERYRLPVVPGLPPFQAGCAGYLAFELARQIERLPAHALDDLGLPEMYLGFYDWVIAHDHQTDQRWLIAKGSETMGVPAEERVRRVMTYLETARSDSVARLRRPTRVTSTFGRQQYLSAVRRVKDYIVAGDVYQVNLSQRFTIATAGSDPWGLYRRLRAVNRAPFAAYLHYPEVAVLSSSPELFLRLEGGDVMTRPMKGTRPRGQSDEEDHGLSTELAASVKDRAENLMITDLMRNDLGRVCIPGSITVPDLFTIETYPTVFQMVSTVQGRVGPGVDAVGLLRACFPGGSVTGAPKIRAIEIIDELEPTQRSVYCGAIGYMGFDGSVEMCIPIRTLLAKGDTVYCQVGGGIVADSDPGAEYDETLHKARGAFLALGVE